MKKIRFLILMGVMLCLLLSVSYGQNTTRIVVENQDVVFNQNTGFPFIDSNNRTQVPFRVSLETFGASVSWDGETSTAIAKKNGREVRVPIGEKYILKDNVRIETDTVALVLNGRTYLPIRPVMEAFDQEVSWDGVNQAVKIESPKVSPITNMSQKLKVGDRTISINAYQVDFSTGDIEIKSALAKDTIGAVDTLENIAKAEGAKLAINGSYFAAYTDDKDPYGVLVVDGKAVHNANDRSVFAFKDNKMDIDFVDTKIKGANGTPTWKYSWNGYWINHTVIENGVSLTVYDNARGQETRSEFGRNYIVEDGVITRIVDNQSVPIPKNGYVANLYGNLGQGVYERFAIGYPFEYEVTFEPESGDVDYWNSLDGAVGAGPALVVDGRIQIDFDKEHFVEEKIKTMSAARSAVGYKQNGQMVLVTTTATIHELADIMLQLGCYEAMNLDGGASSGLYFEGQMIRTPGREISNILFVK